jgi:Nif-specific ferredoxin III
MSPITGTTRGGKPWTPKFINTIEIDKCIGCGRCYKVCGFDVLELIEKPFEGEDEYGDNMKQGHGPSENCIGCVPARVQSAMCMWQSCGMRVPGAK